MEGVTVYVYVQEYHVTFGEGGFIILDEISISTKNFLMEDVMRFLT